jgi:cytochrome P450
MTLPPGPRQQSAWTALQWLYRPLQYLTACRRRYGETFTIRLPWLPPIVVVSHPEAIKEVFSSSSEEMTAGRVNATLRPFLGPFSLLMLDGEPHLRQRRVVLPAFHGERMHAFGHLMLEAAHAAIDGWPVGKPFPVHREMQAITLQVILQAIFGTDDPDFARRAELIPRAIEIGTWPPLLLPALQVDLGTWSPWGRFRRLSAEADAMFFAELRRRREQKADGSRDILALLMEARDERGAPLSDPELRDQIVTLIIAGHETTATALAWALYWATRTHGLVPRLEQEIAGARDGEAEPLVPERVAKLELLDATVRETLRQQPVVPVVGRRIERPAQVAGYDLPAGTIVMPSIYLAQHRPEAFPQPECFIPERFLGVKSSPYEWLPFGGGIRRCVGMAFALYEMKMVLAAVLSRVALRIAPGARIRQIRRSVTVGPSGGLPVIVDDKRPRGAPRRAPLAGAMS